METADSWTLAGRDGGGTAAAQSGAVDAGAWTVGATDATGAIPAQSGDGVPESSAGDVGTYDIAVRLTLSGSPSERLEAVVPLVVSEAVVPLVVSETVD